MEFAEPETLAAPIRIVKGVAWQWNTHANYQDWLILSCRAAVPLVSAVLIKLPGMLPHSDLAIRLISNIWLTHLTNPAVADFICFSFCPPGAIMRGNAESIYM